MNLKNWLVRVAIVAATAFSGQRATHAQLILSDDFTTAGNPNTNDVNFNLAGRQSGAAATVTWWDGGNSQTGNPTNVGQPGSNANYLLLAFGGYAGSNLNVATAANAANLPLLINADMYSTSGNPTDWVSLAVRTDINNDAFPVVGSGQFGFLYRTNTGIQVFNNGGAIASIDPTTGGSSFYFILSDTVGTGSAFNGGGAKVAVYQGGNLVNTYNLNTGFTSTNYLSFGSASTTIGGIDNVALSTFGNGNGTWVSTANGNWGTATNWAGGVIASGVDKTATFLKATGVTINLDTPRTIGNLEFENANYTISGANALTLDRTTGTPTVFVGDTHTATVSVQLSGSDGFAKTGAGTLALSGANNYTGTTTFSGGVVNVATLSNYGVNGSLGNRASASDIGGNVGLLLQGGTLQYTGSTAQSTDRAIRVSTTGGAFIDASGSNSNATVSFTRTTASPDFFENPGARQITFTGTNTGANTFAMPIQNAGGLTTVNKTGAGRWILSGASTYSGPTNIQAGILQIENSTALGAGTFSVNDWTVISNGAALHLNGNLAVTEHFRLQGNGADGLGAIRSLSGTSSISQNMGLDGNTQFGVNAGSQLTIVNSIYAAVGTPGLTKSGDGTLVLSGNNSYTGTTTVNSNSGELIINGNTSGQGNYVINSGSRLGGNGTIGLAAGNSVWISGSPGELSPGYASTGPFAGESYSAGADFNTVGTLTIGTVPIPTSVDLGGSLLVDLRSDGQDLLRVFGDFQLLNVPTNNAMLEINGTTTLGDIDFWGILGWTTVGQSVDFVTFSTFGGGTFANVDFNETFMDAGGREVMLSLDGNSIFLVSTPEPASIFVWSLIGFSVIGCVRNFAKRKR